MTDREKDREKVIKELECCVSLNHNGPKCANCDYADEFNNGDCETYLLSDALALLKEHEKATVEPKRIDLTDETKAWLDKMDAVDALGNIADICMDWDGYRTANGLGGLVNEIWAYARYCADRLQKAQEPKLVHVTADINHRKIGECPNCGKMINSGDYPNYCGRCGQAVKWE